MAEESEPPSVTAGPKSEDETSKVCQDEEVARAYAAALSSASGGAVHSDEQQKKLLEQHSSHPPNLAENIHKIKQAPLQELDKAWRKGTEQMNHNLQNNFAKFGLKFPLAGAGAGAGAHQQTSTSSNTNANTSTSTTPPKAADQASANTASATKLQEAPSESSDDQSSQKTPSRATGAVGGAPKGLSPTPNRHNLGGLFGGGAKAGAKGAPEVPSMDLPPETPEVVEEKKKAAEDVIAAMASFKPDENSPVPSSGRSVDNGRLLKTLSFNRAGAKDHPVVGSSPAPGSAENAGVNRHNLLPAHASPPAVARPSHAIIPRPTLTAIVWKRREGLGKFATKNPWERRKLTLHGSKLDYFTLTAEEKSKDWASNDPNKAHTLTWWEQAAVSLANGTGAAAAATAAAGTGAGTTAAAANASSEAVNDAPRGTMDILREHATVVTSSCQAGLITQSQAQMAAPTPFCLSIRVYDQAVAKWKMCFDTHEQQLQWLVALSNVSIQQSIEEYVVDQAKTSPGGARVTCTLEGDHFVIKNRDGGANEPKVPAVDPEAKEPVAVKDTAVEVPPPPPLADEEPVPSSTRSIQPPQSSPPGLPVSAMQNKVDLPFLPFPCIWSREYFWNVHVKPYLPLIGGGGKAAAEAYEYRAPAVTLYLIGDRLDMALWACNASILYAYFNADTVNLLALLAVFNLVTSCCCAMIQTERYAGGWNHKAATEYAHQVNARGDTPSPKRPARRGPWGSAKKTTLEEEAAQEIVLAAPPKHKAKPKPKAYNAVAGSTTQQLTGLTSRPEPGRVGWRTLTAADFQVRDSGYAANKLKVSAPGALYECIGVDVVDSAMRLPDFVSRVDLDELLKVQVPNETNLPPMLEGAPVPWSCPEIFIISISLPGEYPKLSKHVDDGLGVVLTGYFRMKPQTRAILQCLYKQTEEEVPLPEHVNPKWVNATRLFDEWCQKSPTDPLFQGRFKLIPAAVNTEEVGMPGYITKYNGKPVLIKRAGVTGILNVHKNMRVPVMEFDINLHAFPYLAKQAFVYMRDSFYSKIIGNMGCVIEGRSDDELPECLIGGYQVCYPALESIVQAEDFFRKTEEEKGSK